MTDHGRLRDVCNGTTVRVLAWYRAFRRFGIVLPVWRLHRAIGMGGDQLVAAVAGDRAESEHGDELRMAWAEEFDPMLEEIRPFAGVADLLAEVADRGLTVVLASSGAPRHVESYLDLFDGRSLAAAWTTSEDVDHTKPEPDLLDVAVTKIGGGSAVVLGDTGGFSPEELREAGAREVFDSVEELHEALDRTLLAGRALV